jgi:hypothetical protein
MSKTFAKKAKGVFSIILQKEIGTTVKIFLPIQKDN